MTLLLILALLLDDFESVKQALFTAVQDGDPAALKRSIDHILAFDHGRTPAALVEASEKIPALLKTLRKEVLRLEKVMEDTKDRYVNGKNMGNPAEFLKARDQFGKCHGRIATLLLYQPRLLRAMGKLSSAEALATMLQFTKKPDWYVRAHAVSVLAGKGDAAVKALLDLAPHEKDPGVRVALADALAGRAEARLAIEGYLADPCWSVRIAAARSLAAMPDRRSAESLIPALKGAEGRVRDELNEALKAVTGVNKHGSHEAWAEWWSTNREEFLAGKYVPKPSERADDKGGSTFYGIRVKSTKILFILDVSTSMEDPAFWKPENGADRPKGDRCLDIAQFELKRILRQLPDSAEYNIMLLHAGTTLAFEKAGRGRTHLDRAIKFIDGIKIIDGTNISGAIFHGFELTGGEEPDSRPRPDGFDTIYLITDGLMTSGLTDIADILDRIGETNRFRKIVIHTIGVSATGEGEMLLKPIAAATGGSFFKR